jgi:hypothetical protein
MTLIKSSTRRLAPQIAPLADRPFEITTPELGNDTELSLSNSYHALCDGSIYIRPQAFWAAGRAAS